MYNSKFKQDEDYPTWNPKKIKEIPEIPNWDNSFGDNNLSFNNGSKSCYVNKKILKNKISHVEITQFK